MWTQLSFNLIVTAKSSMTEKFERPPFWKPYWRLGHIAWRHCARGEKREFRENISSKMVACAVVGCSNRTPRDSKRGISFHRLPFKNKPLLKEWQERSKRANLPKPSQSHICSEHFEKECFKSCCSLDLWPARKHKRELNEGTVPTIFPHQQKKSRRLG